MIETNIMKLEQHIRLNQELETLKPYGYQSYISDELDITWAYVITPHNNLLTISFDHYGAFDIAFNYQGTRHKSANCTTKKRDTATNPTSLTPEILTKCEQIGRRFALQNEANLYETPEIGLTKQWSIEKMHLL